MYFKIIYIVFSIILAIYSCLMLLFVIYGFVGIFWKRKFKETNKKSRLAIVVSARNEENVITNLIKSIKNEKYPKEMVSIFIVAHNCTDSTASISRKNGAIVYEYNNLNESKKGFALKYLFEKIDEDYGINSFDGYIVLDSDNTIKEDYLSKMNDAFIANDKKCIITSYRNSSNFGENSISAQYGLFFMMSNRLGLRGRTVLNASGRISGTGFLIPSEYLLEGWNYYSLTEDLEMTACEIINNHKIIYCDEAEFYDEQPTKFKVMYKQRLRWEKGLLIIFKEKALDLIKAIFNKNSKYKYSIYDTLTNIMPVTLILVSIYVLQFLFLFIGFLFNIDKGFSTIFLNTGDFTSFGKLLLEIFAIENSNSIIFQLLFSTGFIYSMLRTILLFIIVAIIGSIFIYIIEGKRIKNVSLWIKIKSSLLYPTFLILQFIIDVNALFLKKVSWDTIPHKGKNNRINK